MPYLEDENGKRIVGASCSIRRLWGLHKEICRYSVLGLNTIRIGELLGVTPRTVSNVLGSRLGSAEVDRLNLTRDQDMEAVQDRFQQLAPFALDVLEEVLLDPNTDAGIPVRVGVAGKLLGYAGHNPTSEVDIIHKKKYIDNDFLKEVNVRAKEIKEELRLSREVKAEEVQFKEVKNEVA